MMGGQGVIDKPGVCGGTGVSDGAGLSGLGGTQTLGLDFTTGSFDPRITFARGTTATYYDGKTTAVAEQNLLLQSQAFGTTPWTYVLGSLTTNEIAPDGSSTASLMSPTGQYHSIRTLVTNISGLVVGATYTMSLWVKNNVGANTYTIWLDGASFSIGTITPTSTWTRYTFTFILPANITTFNLLQDRNASGFGSVYIWGAQLEQRSSATAYTPTTTTSITNYIPQLMTAPMNVPRLDYDPITSKPLGLLIEESRSNLFTSSVNLMTSLGTAASTANMYIAPDGTLNGILITGATSPATYPMANFVAITPSISASTTYTWSIYLKGVIATTVTIAARDQSTGTFIPVICSLTNSWQRFSITLTTGASTTQIGLYLCGANGSFAQWGLQLEAGSFATSYIPTTTGSVTRNADVASMTGANFSSWYNQSQGSFYIECSSYCSYLQSAYALIVDDSTINNRIDLRISYTTLGKLRSQILWNGSTLSNIVESSADLQNNIFTKDAISVSVGNHTAIRNGVIIGTAVLSSVPVATRIIFGSNPSSGEILNGHIKKINYYSTALPASILQALTT